jgi:hypothetical protein
MAWSSTSRTNSLSHRIDRATAGQIVDVLAVNAAGC